MSLKMLKIMMKSYKEKNKALTTVKNKLMNDNEISNDRAIKES